MARSRAPPASDANAFASTKRATSPARGPPGKWPSACENEQKRSLNTKNCREFIDRLRKGAACSRRPANKKKTHKTWRTIERIGAGRQLTQSGIAAKGVPDAGQAIRQSAMVGHRRGRKHVRHRWGRNGANLARSVAASSAVARNTTCGLSRVRGRDWNLRR
jgi:hypothetical protein